MDMLLLAAAGAFAVLNGYNDGGTMLSTGLKVPSLRPAPALVLLAASVVIAPLVITTAVAETLAERLVTFEGDGGKTALLVAVMTAILVIALLGRLGLPTSLTLAIMGAIAGAGWGSGLPTSWGTIGVVLLLAAIAPVLGGAVAYGLSHLRATVPARGGTHRVIRRAHGVGFGLQCLAYGANDGQKMLAVFAVASGLAVGDAPFVMVAAIGVLFGAGVILGLRRISRTIGSGLLPMRPSHAVIAELSAAGTVLASGGIGAPVSMTQAVAGSLIGAGVSESYRRVRWKQAMHILIAWILTLPAALLIAAGAAAALRSAVG